LFGLGAALACALIISESNSTIKARVALSSIEQIGLSIFCLTATISLLALLLLTAHILTPGLLSWTLLAVGGLLKWKNLTSSRLAPKIGEEGATPLLGKNSVLLLLLAILLVAAILRSQPAYYLWGGQDPGVYTNTANYIANHGDITPIDPMVDILRDRPDLSKYYLSASYHSFNTDNEGRIYGNILPGFYVTDFKSGLIIPQFYHLTQIWLAIGNWLFGISYSSAILILFGLGSVLAVYMTIISLTGSQSAALTGAFLLAVNPANSYFAAFPVSETIAGYFFLMGTWALSASRGKIPLLLYTAAAAFFLLFLTRITGFVHVPLILFGVLIMIGGGTSQTQKRNLIYFGHLLLVLYLVSFSYGYIASRSYTTDILESKLKIARKYHFFLPLLYPLPFLGWTFATGLVGRYRRLFVFLRRNMQVLTVAVLLTICILLLYQGYLLGFTDRYLTHRWFGTRWHIAGHRWRSVGQMSISVLCFVISAPVFVVFLWGVVRTSKLAGSASRYAPLLVLTLGFFFLLTVKQLTVPYLYYFARYLTSELIPLAIITACVGMSSTLMRCSKPVQASSWIGLCVISGIALLPVGYPRLAESEGRDFSEGVACLSAIAGPNSLFVIDKFQFAETPVVTPLRFSFDHPTFSFRKTDFPDKSALREPFDYFVSKGYSVYLLTSQDYWANYPYFQKIARIPTRFARYRASKGHYLPNHYRHDSYPIKIHKFLPSESTSQTIREPLPVVCRDFLDRVH
jgi:hypothetical protein